MVKAYASGVEKSTNLSRYRHALRGSTAACALIVALSFAGEAQAQTAWTGGDGNWNDATKWSTGNVPDGSYADPAVPTPTVIGSGAAGTVKIDNTTATSRNIQVGNGSALQVINGGVLNTTPAQNSNGINTIGLSTIGTGQGTMLVDGEGSTWNAGIAGVRVGNGATGVLTVSNGGALKMDEGLLSVGLNAGGNGTLNIDDGSVANTGGAVRLGYNGATGTLNISNGGTLESALLNSIGISENGSTSTGVANISGAGSKWTIKQGADPASHNDDGSLVVGSGAGATGTLNITGGGVLDFKDSTNFASVGINGGTGNVTVSGNGSLFQSAGGLTIGAAGSKGVFLVKDGAELKIGALTLLVGHGDGEGQLTVDHAKVEAQFNIAIGGAYYDTNGNLIAAGAKGTLDVLNGSTVTGGTIIEVGNNATGTVNIRSGSTVSSAGEVQIGWYGGQGTVNVTGNNSKLVATEGILIGHDTDGAASSGELTVADGATVKANGIYVGYGINASGTLNIGTGGAAGIVDTVVGYIAMSGASSTINFNHNEANYVFDTAINDLPGAGPTTGAVNFIGTGTTTLTEVNDYTAATNVNAGRLNIAAGASIANSSLTTVNSGATLMGAGAVGDVAVKSGATIAPTDFKTLTVKDITFDQGSTFAVGVNVSEHGSIAATTATLNGGTVKVVAGTGNYLAGSRYTVLSASGGVTGEFSSLVTSDFAFLKAALEYTDPNKVDLTLTRNSTTFASAATTANQRAVAASLDTAGGGNKVYNAVAQQNAAGAKTAFDALSGEAHASNKAALVGTSLVVSDTIGARLSQPVEGKDARVGAWAQGFGSWTEHDGDGNAAKLESTTGGVLTGIDAAVASKWRVGVAVGYSQTQASVDERRSSLDTDSYHVSAYAGTRQGAIGLNVGALYSWNDISSERSVAFPGFSEFVRGGYDAGTANVFGEANYRLVTSAATFEPFVGLNYINHRTDGLNETGGASALALASDEINVGFATVGVRPSISLGQSAEYSFIARGTLAWRHAFGDVDTAALASIGGGSPFTVAGTPIAENAVVAEAGIDVGLSEAATVGLSWSGQFSDEATENQLKGQFLYRW